MIRLFAGLELPELHRQRLGILRQPLPGAKWVEPHDLHLSLRFAGDIDNRAADEFASSLSEIEFEPFSLTIADLGIFGGREPRVIWAGVIASDPLDQLQRATERAARSAGLPPCSRAFKAHVTLARLRGSRPDPIVRFLASSSALRLEPFTVNRFVLFSSKLNTGGGPYVVEDQFQATRRPHVD